VIEVFVHLNYSPLAGGPAQIFCRRSGAGVPVIFLHGGWGYEIYPLNQQQQNIKGFEVTIPDRSGYGRSTRTAIFSPDFHHRAAQETLALLDALSLRQYILWGHSDGAVIAAMIGLSAPQRCIGVVLESLHYERRKGSDEFFHAMATNPDSFGERVRQVLALEHGETYWRELIRNEGRVWGEIAAATGAPDLFDGRLSDLKVPTLLLHGERDPRTLPGELESIRRALPGAELHIVNGGHSPHSEKSSADEATRVVTAALNRWTTLSPIS
jgi:pimeloyl-ACP methyl ester carboxylesterase